MGGIPVEELDKLVCNNVLAAEVQNGVEIVEDHQYSNGVTGVVFS
jgi:hypothetical protein